MKKVDQGVCEWCLFLVDSLEHITSHHDWIVIQQSRQDINASRAHSWIQVLDGKRYNGEQPMANKVGESLVKKLHGIILASLVRIPWVENVKKIAQEGPI
jgi:hypothetical protein